MYVRSFILNVSQLIGVKYETRSSRKKEYAKITPYAYSICRKIGITGAVLV